MAGINTNNTQWGNFQSDDVKNLNDIYRWIKKLETVISAGGFTGGWTDAGATVKLTTATDSVGMGTASPSAKLHVLHDAEAVAIFQSSTDSYAKIQCGNNLGAVLLLTDGTDEGSIVLDGSSGTLMIDAGGDGIEIAASGVVTIPNLGGSGTGIVAVSNTGVLGFTSVGGVAGSDTQVQFNDSGAFGAEAAFTYNKTTNQLTVGASGDAGSFTVGNTATKAAMFNFSGSDSSVTARVGSSGFSVRETTTSDTYFFVNPVGKIVRLGNTSTGNITYLELDDANTWMRLAAARVVVYHGNGVGNDGQLFIGSSAPTSSSPDNGFVNATGGYGTDIAGANITIAGGKSTGNSALGGDVNIATSDAVASGTTLQSLTNKFIIKKSGDIQIPSKGIDTTAGDSATINSNCGRFRKDTSGSTFTLTNSRITANSIILLTNTTASITTGNQLSVVAGSGSAVITFETNGVAAAPSANMDVNFWVIN